MQDYTPWYIIKRLMRNHIKPHLKTMLLAIFFMIISGGCSAIIIRLVQPAIDEIFITLNKKMLFLLPVCMVCISTIKGIAEYFQNYFVKVMGQKIVLELQFVLYKHLLSSDIELIQKESSGRIISRFTNDITLMRGSVSTLLVGLARHLLSVVFVIIVMFNFDPNLSIITFVVFPLSIYPIQYIGKRMRKIVYNAQDKLAEYTSRLDQTFSSIKIVKSFSGEEYEMSKASKVAGEIYKLYIKAIKLDSLTSPITEILSGLAIGGLIMYGGFLVMNGKSSPGTLLAFISAFISVYLSLIHI